MKKILFSTIFVVILVFLIFACASVKSQGITYFIGRSESDLISHFGYNGREIESIDTEYDKIIFFTNKTLQYQMSKTNIVRYKVSRQSEIMSLQYNEFSDGCLTWNNAAYYGNHYGIEGMPPNNRVIHRNDNSAIRPRINEFNNIIDLFDNPL